MSGRWPDCEWCGLPREKHRHAGNVVICLDGGVYTAPSAPAASAAEVRALRDVEAATRALREPVGHEAGATSRELDAALSHLDTIRKMAAAPPKTSWGDAEHISAAVVFVPACDGPVGPVTMQRGHVIRDGGQTVVPAIRHLDGRVEEIEQTFDDDEPPSSDDVGVIDTTYDDGDATRIAAWLRSEVAWMQPDAGARTRIEEYAMRIDRGDWKR